MQYKDAKNTDPAHKGTRMLRSLWEVKTYKGTPKKRKPKTETHTVIAWNAVDANRKSGGKLAEEPKRIGFVTWPRPGEEHVYLIENPTDGPIEDEKIMPTVGSVDEEADWDF